MVSPAVGLEPVSCVASTAASCNSSPASRRLQLFLLGARLRRHRLDRLEFVAADKIHAGEHSFELLPDPRFDLAP